MGLFLSKRLNLSTLQSVIFKIHFFGGVNMSFSQWFYDTKGYDWIQIQHQGVSSELKSSLYAEYEIYCESNHVAPVFHS